MENDKKQSALDVQVGGNHYKKCKIQPVEYCIKNGLGTCESAVVKYVTRHKDKNGRQDLEKAKHYLDLLIEHEYPNPSEVKKEVKDPHRGITTLLIGIGELNPFTKASKDNTIVPVLSDLCGNAYARSKTADRVEYYTEDGRMIVIKDRFEGVGT